MSLLQAGYVALFALATVGCFFGAVRTHVLEESEIRRSLSVFLALTGVWGASGVLLLLAPSLRAMSAVYAVGLVFGFSTVLAWLWFCSAYAGRAYHYDRRIQAAAAVVFVLVSSIKLTNPFHNLYFVPGTAAEPFVHFAPEVGTFYWSVTALAYAGSAVGLYMLFELYFAARVDSVKIGLLTVIIALPVVPKLLAVGHEGSLLLLFYEPVGAAVFAIGVVTVAREGFLSVRRPGQRQLAERLTDPVLIVDRSGRLVEYNERALALFPKLSEAVGELLAETVPSLAEAEQSDRIELVQDGRKRYYLFSQSAITLESKPVGRAIVLSDVTDLEKQRTHLEQQTAHLENLTEAMAHELRNPLTIVQGNLQLLGETVGRGNEPRVRDDGVSDAPGDGTVAESASGAVPDESEADRDAVEDAMEGIERIETVVDDLISIMEYGTPLTDTDPHSIESIVADARERFDGDVDLSGDCERRIVADRARCTELFRHLFRLHAERGASTVAVVLFNDGFAVESDGEGFVTADHEKLFKYGAETGEDVRIILANAWTLSNLHGWCIEADPNADGPRIVVSGVEYAADASE